MRVSSMVQYPRHQNLWVSDREQQTPRVEPLEVLEVRDLAYRHEGSQEGLQSLSFRLERGQCLVITGRIGAGKTTLLRTLLGLLPKDQGKSDGTAS